MSAPLRRYRRGDATSYALGWFAVLELLRWRPEAVVRVALHRRLPAARRTELEARCRQAGVSCHDDDALVERLRHKGNAYALAVFRSDALPTDLDPAAPHLLLVRPSQHGNVGTIARSMLAFGVRDLALVEPALEAVHPHVVRASVGAVFALRCRSFPSLHAYLREATAASPERKLYLFSGAAERSLDALTPAPPFTLAFGPEWPALQPVERALGTCVRIPQSDLVESLNLAVAVSIALYATVTPPAGARDAPLRSGPGRGGSFQPF